MDFGEAIMWGKIMFGIDIEVLDSYENKLIEQVQRYFGSLGPLYSLWSILVGGNRTT